MIDKGSTYTAVNPVGVAEGGGRYYRKVFQCTAFIKYRVARMDESSKVGQETVNTVIIHGLIFCPSFFLSWRSEDLILRGADQYLGTGGSAGISARLPALLFGGWCLVSVSTGNSSVPFYIAMSLLLSEQMPFSLSMPFYVLNSGGNMVISGVVINILAMAITIFLFYKADNCGTSECKL